MASLSKQIQKFGFIIESIDIFDYITTNKAFRYLLESRCFEQSNTKNCLNMQFTVNTGNPSSDLNLILRNNCNWILCINYDSIFTLAKKISRAVFKENVDTSYYNDFGRAAKNKINEYIQLGVVFAVFLLYNFIAKCI